MAKPLNICLIGSKFMGRTHSNAYLKVHKFFRDLPCEPVMHTICGRNAEELKEFAELWGWQNASTNWREAIQNPEIDLVDIGTPNHLHKEMALAALEAGKYVACEKPLAGTLDEARDMVEAAKRHPTLKNYVWYNYRRCPALAFAHQLVASGKLGRLYHVRGFYLQDWAGPDTPMVWRFQGDIAGSGSLGDLCAHSIDAARFVTGEEFESVSGAILETFIKQRKVIEGGGGEISGHGAAASDRMEESTVDDAALFTARFTGGAVATFEATRLSTGDKNGNRLEVHGEKGAIRWNFERLHELQWFDNTLPAAQRGWSTINVSDAAAGHPYAKAWWPTGHNIGYEHGFINQVADMLRDHCGERPEVPLADFSDAYKTQQVLEAVTRSARDGGATVRLDEIG